MATTIERVPVKAPTLTIRTDAFGTRKSVSLDGVDLTAAIGDNEIVLRASAAFDDGQVAVSVAFKHLNVVLQMEDL
jgi:hypothetical protein